MPNFKIETPNTTFDGLRFGLKFKKGLAFTNDEKHVREALDRGYTVSEIDATKPVTLIPAKTSTRKKTSK